MNKSGPDAPERNRTGRRGRVLKTVTLTAAGILVVSAAAAAYAFEHLNSNIRTAPLYTGTHLGQSSGAPNTTSLGTETPDAFGNTPVNILLIGSDTRSSAADCRIGGDCGPGANADVEMLLHLSADRSNATVMSIPRDTMMRTPACSDPQGGTGTTGTYGQINNTLQYGPACTVAAVHALTAIPIDHFAMVDFGGVVDISDAVGGVNVCVDNNVYDPYSGLKLAKGTHTLVGSAALAFLRTRHGFGDGSDLGRTYAQHIFLTHTVDKLKSAGILRDPVALWSLANTATKALTVDPALGSLTKILALARDLDKVPRARLTFTTMQTDVDPNDPNRVVVSPEARHLFQAIINDQPLTPADAATTAAAATAQSATTAASPAPATTAVPPSHFGTPAPTATKQALNNAHAQTGDQNNSCVQIGNQYTVQLNGTGMTPVQAYAAAPDVKDSAP